MNNFIMDISKKLKKPVEAIQCANSFSLLQRKMYNVLLANAAGNLHPEITHRITMRALCSLMGYRSNDYKTIKDRFRELRRMDIEWDVINEDGNKVWTNTSPLSLARVIEGEGVCEYEFTPSLVPFLDRPAQYAKFSLAIQAKFKSSYGLALYENCERYKKIGYTRVFDLPTFRKLMGVGATEYLDFFALKRRVINKAVKEVNQYADFDIEPEYKKQGRAVISIRFIILKSETNILEGPIKGEKKQFDSLVMKIKEYFGLQQKDIEKYIKLYGNEYVDQKVNDILASDSFKKGLIKNMAGYLKKALSENYQLNLSSKKVVEKKRREQEKLVSIKRERDELISQLQKEFDNYLSKKLPEMIQALTQENKTILFNGFESHITTTYYFNLYKHDGLNNILVSDHFFSYMKTYHKKFLDHLISFEDFAQKNYYEIIKKIQTLDDSLKSTSCEAA